MISQWTLKMGCSAWDGSPLLRAWLSISNWSATALYIACFVYNFTTIIIIIIFPPFPLLLNSFMSTFCSDPFAVLLGDCEWLCDVTFIIAFCCNIRYLWSWRLLLRKTCFLCIQKVVFYPGSSCSSVSIKFFWRTSCSLLVIHWGINNLHSRVAIVAHWPQLSPRGNCLTR